MRNVLLAGWRRLPSLLLFTALLYFTPLAHSEPQHAIFNCPEPQPSVANQTANTITFSWAPVTGAVQYKTWCHRHGDSGPSQQFSTGNTQFSYSGLPSGTYDFYFVTECADGYSDIVIIVDIIM